MTSSVPGEPCLPAAFKWKGRTITISTVMEKWKQTGDCHHGSGEHYVRKHWYRVRSEDGSEMKLYCERQPRGRGSSRWRLYTIRLPKSQTQWPAMEGSGLCDDIAPSILERMNYWLVKQEPEDYSWTDFVKDRKIAWTGVRNYQARNNLRAMAKGESVLFYHSGTGKEIVGVARVVKAAYPDPTAKQGDWVCVELSPVKPLNRAISLAEVKEDQSLQEMALVRNSRLSVMPVQSKQFERILKLASTTL